MQWSRNGSIGCGGQRVTLWWMGLSLCPQGIQELPSPSPEQTWSLPSPALLSPASLASLEPSDAGSAVLASRCSSQSQQTQRHRISLCTVHIVYIYKRVSLLYLSLPPSSPRPRHVHCTPTGADGKNMNEARMSYNISCSMGVIWCPFDINIFGKLDAHLHDLSHQQMIISLPNKKNSEEERGKSHILTKCLQNILKRTPHFTASAESPQQV